MPGHEWEEILRIRKQLDVEDKVKKDEADRLRLQQQVERSLQERLAQQQAQQQAQEKRHAVSLAASHTRRIFEDLATHDPGIKRFPLQEVYQDPVNESSNPSTNIALKWGNKFELNPEEKRWIESNRYRPPGLVRLFTSPPPESILRCDFYSISAHIDFNTTTIGGERLASESVSKAPNNIASPLAKALRMPTHSYEVLRKGIDYWTDPPRPGGSSSSSSGGEGCCCNMGN